MADHIIKRNEFSGLARFEEHDIDLRVIVQLIKQNYKLFIILVTVSFIGAIFYIHRLTPVYRSEAILQVNDNNMSSALTVGGMAHLAMMGGQATSELETTLLNSPYVLGEVAKKLNFTVSVAPKYNSFFAKQIAWFRGDKIHAEVATLEVPNSLLGRPLTLTVQRDQRIVLEDNNGKKILEGKAGQVVSANYHSGLVKIEIKKIDGPVGAQFTVIKNPVNDVAAGLSSGLSITAQGATGVLKLGYDATNPEEAQTILQNILTVAIQKDMKQKAEEADKVGQFMLKQLPLFRNQLQKEELKLNQFGAKTGVFDLKSEDAVLMQSITGVQESLENLDMKKSELLQKFTPLHPFIISIQRRRDALVSKLHRLKKKLNELPLIAQEGINLQQTVRMDSDIYANFFKSLQQVEITKAGTTSAVKLLSPASYPAFPVPVNKRAILLGSLFLGFVLSLGVIILRFILSPTIEEPDEVEQMLGIPVLGLLPFSQKQKAHDKFVFRNKLNNRVFLLAKKHPKDVSIEGLRGLRTAIQLALIEKNDNVIAITGCSPGIGKSFISSNLSFLMGELGKRVLVIDGDIRLGKMQYAFGKNKEPGLSSYLEDRAPVSDIIQTVVPGKLDFISTGPYPSNPSELLSKDAFAQLLQEVKKQYDIVIIDTAPVLAVTDPSLILRYSALNLLVLGVGKDRLKEAEHAKNVLEKGGAILSGVIMNNLKSHNVGYGYGKYSYHYKYDNKTA